MYDFHYSFIKKQFDAELLFTDTDSLTYEIKSKNVHEEVFKLKHLFDFSNYPEDSKFFNPTNKNVIGKMKDDSEVKTTDEFVCWSQRCIQWKILMIKNLIRQKEWILQLGFMDSKTRKNSDIKWEEFKEKNIKWEHTKSTKYHYLFLMNKDLFYMMVFKLKKSQIRKIFKKRRDSWRWSRIKINVYK